MWCARHRRELRKEQSLMLIIKRKCLEASCNWCVSHCSWQSGIAPCSGFGVTHTCHSLLQNAEFLLVELAILICLSFPFFCKIPGIGVCEKAFCDTSADWHPKVSEWLDTCCCTGFETGAALNVRSAGFQQHSSGTKT